MPKSFSVDTDLLAFPDVTKSDEDLNFVLSYIRSNAISSDHDSITPTWAGCRSLLSTKSSPIMQVGFLPYLPHPVTKHETVYTALHNFLAVLVQLEQESLPVFCDEGVYCTVADIILKHPEEFKNLIPMMGGFHMAKAALHCGIEDALLETGVFD